MSTSYFWINDPCNCCGRANLELHIGTQTQGPGHFFTFRGYWLETNLGKIQSRADWRRVIENGTGEVRDEYGKKVPDALAWFDSLTPAGPPSETDRDKKWVFNDAEGFRINLHNFL